MKSFYRGDSFPGLLAALTAFCFYFATLAPSIGFIDSGELAAVAYAFGIAHPTGYPLFTLLAGVFAHIPLGTSVIWRLNLFAALCCAASVFFFFRVFLLLLASVKEPGQGSGAPAARRLAAATGALILAFSRTFWSQAVGVEVYSLHLLLVSLVLFSFLRALPGGAFSAGSVSDPAPRRKAWYLFSFVLGLSFANHMTTLLLLPGLVYAYFAAHGRGLPAWKNAGRALPFFLLGLLPYLYLPLRAASHPALNWGAIVDWETFRWHVSGRQYSGWMFHSLEPAGRQFALFSDTLPAEFGYLALLPALAGLVVLFRRARRLFAFTVLLFAGCLLYSINYDIPDIVNYFLLAYIALALWSAFGLGVLLERARAARRAALFAAAYALASLCFLLPLFLNYRAVDESGNHGPEDYARNVLGEMEPNAVLLTTQWDHLIGAVWYLQTVEGVRRDVVLIDRELLRRSWYHRHLAQRHPWLAEASRAEIGALLPELEKFEQELPYDPAVIQGAFERMTRSLLANSLKTRPVYATPEIEPAYLGDLGRIPQGPVFRLFEVSAEGGVPPFVPHEIFFRPFPKDNAYFRILAGYYAMAYANQGLLLGMRGDLGRSEYFLRKALAIQPDSREAALWLGQVEAARAARPTAAP
jgi:hypothetical protein